VMIGVTNTSETGDRHADACSARSRPGQDGGAGRSIEASWTSTASDSNMEDEGGTQKEHARISRIKRGVCVGFQELVPSADLYTSPRTYSEPVSNEHIKRGGDGEIRRETWVRGCLAPMHRNRIQ